MSFVSLRLSWATRDHATLLPLAAAALGAGVALGAVSAVALGGGDPRPLFWGMGFVTAAFIALDFPGAGQPRWSELELSLPIAPRDLQRARLLLSLAAWLVPLACAVALGASGVVSTAIDRAALPALSSAAASVLFAVAVRHGIGLGARGRAALVLRLVMIGSVLLGFSWPSLAGAAVTLLAAGLLLGVAHRRAAQPLELPLQPVATQATQAAQALGGPASFERLTLRYVLASGRAPLLLGVTAVWAFGVNSGWIQNAGMHAGFALLWSAYHVTWSARWLRLGHLPFARERLFRYVTWPALAALLVGALLAGLVHRDELCSIDLHPTSGRDAGELRAPQRYWRFASGEVPLVTAPGGESYRPEARRIGLGSALVVYDPYEVGPGSTPAFLRYQLGRLIQDQRALELRPEQLEALTAKRERRVLSGASHPELRDPLATGEWLVGAALLGLGALLGLRFVIRRGPSHRHAKNGRPRLSLAGEAAALSILALLVVQALALVLSGGKVHVVEVALGPCLRWLAAHLGWTLAGALLLGALLYRSLLQRFRHMEASPRARAFDGWFAEI